MARRSALRRAASSAAPPTLTYSPSLWASTLLTGTAMEVTHTAASLQPTPENHVVAELLFLQVEI